MDISLNLILLVPLLATFLIALCPESWSRWIAIVASWAIFAICVYLGVNYHFVHPADGQLYFEYKQTWFTTPFPVEWKVGVDGMSLCLVLLSGVVTLASVFASTRIGQTRSRLYYSMMMLLTTSVLGVFVSQNLLQFFVMFELELVPMYFLIAIWGGPNRSYASMKFLLYTFFGGVFMLAALLFMYFQLGASGVAKTFDMVTLASQASSLSRASQILACFGFMLAFLIKLPSFPFHTWLPDAHVEAPTPISMILAGLLLKMGSYGLVRICLGFFPDVITMYAPAIVMLGCFNVVWAAIACLVQQDMKRVIAFSSVSHMGFILIGLGALSAAALNGAIFQMISHGVISAALFFLVGVVYDRVHTRNINEIGGGLAAEMPNAFYFWMLAALANLGLPALAGFVAEVTCFYGAFTGPVAGANLAVRGFLVFACLGVILSAGYMLWLLKRLFFGPENPRWRGHLTDMTLTEKFVGVVLAIFIIGLGVYPLSITHYYAKVADTMVGDVVARNRSVSSNPDAESPVR